MCRWKERAIALFYGGNAVPLSPHPPTAPTSDSQIHPPNTPTGDTTHIHKPDPGGGAPTPAPTARARVADATACVSLALHGPDEVGAVAPGDVFRLTGGLFTLDRGGGGATLRAGRRGGLARLGRGDLVFAEAPDMSTVRFAVDPATGLYAPAPDGPPLPTKFWAPPVGKK